MQARTTILALLILGAAVVAAAADPQAFREALRAKADALAQAGTRAVKGQDGFYFLAGELRSYGAGPFWGADAVRASVATRNQDPLEAILDFQRQLKAAGVQLILVPVPGKVTVFADKLDPALAFSQQRLDVPQQAFYDILRKEGIQVVDLLPDYLALRAKGPATYCRQDTHWTPLAMERAADLIANLIKEQPWYAGVAKQPVARENVPVECHGDLVTMLGETDVPKETLMTHKVTLGGKPVENDPRSPVVIMGDSHTIVYHQPINGGITAEQAGLPDQLAAELGFAPDLFGVLGSGANASRITLARRKDNLAGKKCVVWCFTAREFTEADQGWMKIPVVR